MSNNKQTAVQWLVEKLKNYDSNMIELFENEIQQAKEMEKQQRKQSYDNGYANGQLDLITE